MKGAQRHPVPSRRRRGHPRRPLLPQACATIMISRHIHKLWGPGVTFYIPHILARPTYVIHVNPTTPPPTNHASRECSYISNASTPPCAVHTLYPRRERRSYAHGIRLSRRLKNPPRRRPLHPTTVMHAVDQRGCSNLKCNVRGGESPRSATEAILLTCNLVLYVNMFQDEYPVSSQSSFSAHEAVQCAHQPAAPSCYVLPEPGDGGSLLIKPASTFLEAAHTVR
jgi:hypothetical protein